MLILFNWGAKSVQHLNFCNFFQNQKSYKQSKKKISRDKFICAHCRINQSVQSPIHVILNRSDVESFLGGSETAPWKM